MVDKKQVSRTSRRIVFAPHAHRHGYTIDDVAYAVENMIEAEVSPQRNGSSEVRFTGMHLDSLVPSLEVVMKVFPNGKIIIYHVNAETGNFFKEA
jgi:hypothetical protein